MRALIIGTDFSYNSKGNLVPIEINTNTVINKHTVEEKSSIFNLSKLKDFVLTNKFNKITYIGALHIFSDKLVELTRELKIEYEFITQFNGVSIPFIEDDESHLIIRSAYDNTAIVDEEYCKVKTNFLDLISDEKFASQYAYKEELTNEIINHIHKIPDNGNHPNFIVKTIYPHYDKDEYPKLYKIENKKQLESILNSMPSECFIMEYHLNKDKTYENHIKIIRSYNMLFPPNLDNIPLGQHIKLTYNELNEDTKFDSDSLEVAYNDRGKYLTSDNSIGKPKLSNDDRVEMADGSVKTAADLKVGDLVRTIKIANPHLLDLENDNANFLIDFETFLSGSTFSSNKITKKTKVEQLVDILTITFTDGSTWEDTDNSKYLTLRDNEVRFISIKQAPVEYSLRVGDEIILIDTSKDDVMTPILKKVQKVETKTTIFSGWQIEIEEKHIFLTLNEEGQSFAAIEHNPAFCIATWSCFEQYSCDKGFICCYGTCGIAPV